MSLFDRCRVTEELNAHEIEEAKLPDPLSDHDIEQEAIKAVNWFRSNVEECMDILHATALSDGDASYTADIASRYMELSLIDDFESAAALTNDLVRQWIRYQLTDDYDTRTAVRALIILPDYIWEQDEN